MVKEHEDHKINKQIIRLQANIRGYLLRKQISDRFTFFYKNIDKIIQIQSWWRGLVQRKRYIELLEKRRQQNVERYQNKYRKVQAKFADVLERYKEQVNYMHTFIDDRCIRQRGT